MSEHRMLRGGLAALVIVLLLMVLLGAGAASIQQSAWSEGYTMGLIAGNSEGDALSQYVLYNNGQSPSPASAIGGFFKFGLLFFGLLFVAKFFFGMAHMRRWQMAAGPGGPEGPEGQKWQPGFRRHGPPWGCQPGRSASEQAAQEPAEPAPGTADDEATDVAVADETVK